MTEKEIGEKVKKFYDENVIKKDPTSLEVFERLVLYTEWLQGEKQVITADKPFFPLGNIHFTSDMDKGATVLEVFAAVALCGYNARSGYSNRENKVAESIEDATELINQLKECS